MDDRVFKFNEDGDRARFSPTWQRKGSSLSEPTSVAMVDWRDEIFAVLKAAEIRQVGYGLMLARPVGSVPSRRPAAANHRRRGVASPALGSAVMLAC
jgi:hypothetical protein